MRLEAYHPKAATSEVDRGRLSGETATDYHSIGIEFRFVVPPLVSHKYLNYLCAGDRRSLLYGQRYNSTLDRSIDQKVELLGARDQLLI